MTHHHGRRKDSVAIAAVHKLFNDVAEGALVTRDSIINFQIERNCGTDPFSVAVIISEYRKLYPEYFIIPDRKQGWRRVKKPDAAKS